MAHVEPKDIDDLENALLEGLRDTIEHAFALSQKRVPRDESTLADSGVFNRHVKNGCEIVYRARHAATVDTGRDKPVVVRKPRMRTVREHPRSRKGSKAKDVHVSGFERKYETGTIAHLRHKGRDIGFRVVGTEAHPMPVLPPTWFFTDSLIDALIQLPKFCKRQLKKRLR